MKRVPSTAIICVTVFFAAVMTVHAQSNQSTEAVIGSVSGVSSSQITVQEAASGKSIETKLDKSIRVFGQNKKVLKLDAIKPNDLVAVISSTSASGTGSAQVKRNVKIFVRDASGSAISKRQAVAGVITSIDQSTITLTHFTQQSRVYQITVDRSTQYKIKDIPLAKLTDLQPGQRVAVVGELNSQGAVAAKIVHVIPGQANGLTDLNGTASGSGKLKLTNATVSANPRLTIKPTIKPNRGASPSATNP